jgi:hypothetical protein
MNEKSQQNILSEFKFDPDKFLIRLKLFIEKIKDKGIDPEQVPGLKKQARTNYKKRGNIPASSSLLYWSTNFDISLNWLFLGEGSMFRGEIPKKQSAEPKPSPTETETMRQRIQDLEKQVKYLEALADAKDETLRMYRENHPRMYPLKPDADAVSSGSVVRALRKEIE